VAGNSTKRKLADREKKAESSDCQGKEGKEMSSTAGQFGGKEQVPPIAGSRLPDCWRGGGKKKFPPVSRGKKLCA